MAIFSDMRPEHKYLTFPGLLVFLVSLGALHQLRATIASQHIDMNSLGAFYYKLATQDFHGALAALAILAAGLLLARRLAWVERVPAWMGEHPAHTAAITTFLLAIASVLIYRAHPLTMDEYAPYFQAQVFAAGRLHGEFPPELIDWLIPGSFQTGFFFVSKETGHVISGYWPGFALLLTPFMKAGVPWLLNPLLAGANVLLLWHLARRIFPDRRTAGWVLLFTLTSSAFIVNAFSYYSMNARLFFNLLYAALLLQPTTPRLFLAGLVGSFALVLHSPVAHTFFAIPWIIWVALRPGRMQNLIVLAAGYLPLSVFLGLGWWWYKLEMMGALVQSVQAQAPSSAATFGERVLRYIGNAFVLPSAKILLFRFFAFIKLNLWAMPGLVFLAWFGFLKWRHSTPVRLLAISTLLTVAAYFIIPFSQGHGWGYRYFHSVWFVLPLLGAAVLFPPGASGAQSPAFLRLAATVAVLSLVFGNGLRLYQVDQFMDRHLSQRPVLNPAEREVCFLDVQSGFYKKDLVQNDPFLRGNGLYFVSQGPEADAAFLARFSPGARLRWAGSGDTVWVLDRVPGPPCR